METFFSGTDVNTLIQEGNDSNHFVSLIVNNKGVYTAAITRKVTKTVKGMGTECYKTFENKEICTSKEIDVTSSILEYYPLDIILNTPIGLEDRIKELTSKPVVPSFPFDKKESKQPLLFDDVPYTIPSKPLPSPNFKTEEEVIVAKVENQNDIIKDLVNKHLYQIITGNIFAFNNPKIDINEWVSNMEKAYKARFNSFDEFAAYASTIIDACISEADMALYTDDDDFNADIMFEYSNCLIESLEEYNKNPYIQEYINCLMKF